MTNSFLEHRIRTARALPPLALVAFAALSAACAAPDRDDEPPAPPLPGVLHVAHPLRLTARARIPEKEAGFLAADVHDGWIAFTHDGALPALSPGDVLGGTQGGGYLARVTSVQPEGATRVVVRTEPAALTELVAEGEVHVHYDAADYAAQLDDYIQTQKDRGDDEGERTAAEAQALKLGGTSVKLLALAGQSLPASCGVGESGGADLDIDAQLTPVLDIDLKIGPKGGLDLRPELKRLRIVASGQLDVTATLRGTGTLEAGCSIDLLALAGGAASIPLPPLTFWVGPVPVIVTTEVVPVATADVNLTVEAADITASAQTSVGLEAGVDYQNRTWSTVWSPRCSVDGTAFIESPGNIGADCTVRAGAELRARLYGVLGPNVGVQAYAHARADSAPPYCTYDASIDGGVRAYAEAALGVSVGPLDLTLAELPLVDMDLVHFDGPEFSGSLRDAPECAE